MLEQKAPIPEWQSPGGLRIRAPLDPDFDPRVTVGLTVLLSTVAA